jgi:hypothetical protein
VQMFAESKMCKFTYIKWPVDAVFDLRYIVSEPPTYKNGQCRCPLAFLLSMVSVIQLGKACHLGSPCCLEPRLYLFVLAG